jgi:transcriptional regulator with XRE-family HTH domain
MYKLQLKELRKKAGFKTQGEIAAHLGIKERKYASWEREEVALTLEDAFMLSIALGCTPNDLCGWPEGKNEGRTFNDAFEKELLECYRSCTPRRQDRILDTARDAAGMSKEATERSSSEPKQFAC